MDAMLDHITHTGNKVSFQKACKTSVATRTVKTLEFLAKLQLPLNEGKLLLEEKYVFFTNLSKKIKINKRPKMCSH